MEKIDVRGCFPVMNGGDGVILSKRGDVCYGWEVVLPPAFRCNEQRYDTIVQALFSAVTLLPDYTIVHKQDVYMKKKYVALHLPPKASECSSLTPTHRPTPLRDMASTPSL